MPGLEGCVQMQDCVGMGTQEEVVCLVVVGLVDEVVVGVQVWRIEELVLIDAEICGVQNHVMSGKIYRRGGGTFEVKDFSKSSNLLSTHMGEKET